MSTRVAVLGSTGMLGSMVSAYLSKNKSLAVIPLSRPTFDAEKFDFDSKQLIPTCDYVVNCIGIIKPYCKDDDQVGVERAIRVNALFPHRLAAWASAQNTKLIQIATDCVYSGFKGQYVEADLPDALDVYGKSKSLGEVRSGAMLNIRCSIIGPEQKAKVSLLDWYRSQPMSSELKGFAHHFWNGVTTLQFAELCERIIQSSTYDALVKTSSLHHFVPNETVDKYQLLQLFSKTFNGTSNIVKVDNIGRKVDRTLATSLRNLEELYPRQGLEMALANLRPYLD